MLGEAVQFINKLPALRFLFFLLVHGTTPAAISSSLASWNLLKTADTEFYRLGDLGLAR